MKKKIILFVMLISLFFTIEITATNLQVASTSTGCTSIDGKGVATFVVKSPVAQTCDLSFLMMPGEYEDGSFTSVTLKVNGVTLPNPITFSTYGWQPANTTGNAVSLNVGENTIQFISGRDDVPLVRNLKEYYSGNNKISLTPYALYKTDENSASVKLTQRNDINYNYNFAQPELLYRPGASLNQSYYYTFILPLQYNEKDTAVFYVPSNTATIDFNMYLFHENPNEFSESATCNGNRYLFYEKEIKKAGTYYLLLEAKNVGECGGVTITINNSTTYRNSFVSNTSFNVLKSEDYSDVHVLSQDSCYNMFTANLKSSDEYHEADSYLYLKKCLRNGEEIIVTYNDDNTVVSDFDWGKNARIRTILSDSILYKVGLCSMYPYSYFSPDICDIYHSFWCNANIPNLEVDSLKYQDIIESGNMSPKFNCIAWSGGDNLNCVFPHQTQYSLTWFDKFYNNEEVRNSFTYRDYQRSSNMPRYERCPITSEDAIIDVWGRISERGDTIFTHASIKNNQYDSIPHGYAWESKLGWGYIRVFHPREAIKGHEYGRILASYKIADESNGLYRSIYENVSEDNVEIRNITLSSMEIDELSTLSSCIKNDYLDELFVLWESECNNLLNVSNPNILRELDIYKDIITELLRIPKPIMYLYKKYKEELPLIELFISEAVDRSNSEIRKFWDEAFVNKDNIITSTKSKINSFYKQILQFEDPNSIAISANFKRSNTDNFNVTTSNNLIKIEVEIDEVSIYCIEVVDLKTNFIQTVVPETQVQAGNYEYSINIPSGNYVVAYYLNGNMNAKKVQVK